MRITSKGQVTIPQAVREAAGLRPGTEVDFVIEDGVVRLQKTPGSGRARFKAAAAGARARVDIGMSTEENMRFVRGEWPYEGP